MNLEFEYENRIISFNVIKRKRKSMCIKIEDDGKITVIVPLRVSKETVLKAVENKASWIKNKQDEMKTLSNKKIRREVVEGANFMYLGKEYPLHIIFDENMKNVIVELNNPESNNRFIVHTNTLNENKIKLALEKWYRQRTLQIVSERIEHYQYKFNDKVTNIRVKEQKRRWASCTAKNAILFNWRCSMAREDVLDYIVVHEMCHIDHKDHSKKFWDRVEEIMPDYKEKHEWLRTNGINMTLEN